MKEDTSHDVATKQVEILRIKFHKRCIKDRMARITKNTEDIKIKEVKARHREDMRKMRYESSKEIIDMEDKLTKSPAI
ncbi:MAG: hypothetical protein LBF41_02910 [Deltaproteobacteria bacterium]|jgi:hypothetical protein|nr:hypothetical protein [Deltaproteobacteria bacterium]